jgi:hypothetical protein
VQRPDDGDGGHSIGNQEDGGVTLALAAADHKMTHSEKMPNAVHDRTEGRIPEARILWEEALVVL